MERKEKEKLMQKTVVKKVQVVRNPFNERLRLNKLKKIQMVDAWTQTTPRKDDEEEEKKDEPPPPLISELLKATTPTPDLGRVNTPSV